MARFPSHGRRSKIQSWLYITSALLLTIGVIMLILPASSGSAKKGGQPTADEQVAEPDVPEVQPVQSVEPEDKASELVSEAMQLINAKPEKCVKARDILNESLMLATNAERRNFVKGQLSQLADRWLFSSTVFPEDTLCGGYECETGDLLSAIGSRHNVPWEILAKINGISRPETLQAGQKIKVINGPFHARVNRSHFTMDIYLQKTFVRSFPVGLGQPGRETPTGLWVVKGDGKLIKPPWTDPDTAQVLHPGDPDYPLGSRWIGLEGVDGSAKDQTGFGIHGTKDPKTIGTAGSRGCIRLHNGDAILVYKLLMPGLSQVEVVQ
jgi:LysM repeat protein